MCLYHAGRTEEAIALLDVVGETLMQTGNKQAALEVINQIVLMNPLNVEEYRKLLFQMQSS
jgi:regulator of sirC expression with transglutaminase-like and TPR domain